ncbi:hypothetical protein HUW63_28045 [Myxococcus sp. AM001]|nr:hypothetical protein [Myxococcus sp. AM001]
MADVSKTFESFRSNLRAIAESTQLSIDMVDRWADDIISFARAKYIKSVSIALHDTQNTCVRGAKFTPSESASGWVINMPGNNLWPATPNGSLMVIVEYNDTWHSLAANTKADFKATLKLAWSPSDIDTTFSGMTPESTRHYASNSYGIQHTTYRKP